VSASKNLTGPQLAVLAWVADGCPEGVYEGHQHKVHANALANRYLVAISGSGRTWSCSLTERGRAYLEYGPGLTPAPPVREHVDHGHDPLTTELVSAASFLVVETDSGGSAHLVRRAAPGRRYGRRWVPRPAIADHHLNTREYARHDAELLVAEAWDDETLCGHRWSAMLSDERREYLESHEFSMFHFSPLRGYQRDVRCSRCWSTAGNEGKRRGDSGEI
jgi:hypothetical protein